MDFSEATANMASVGGPLRKWSSNGNSIFPLETTAAQGKSPRAVSINQTFFWTYKIFEPGSALKHLTAVRRLIWSSASRLIWRSDTRGWTMKKIRVTGFSRLTMNSWFKEIRRTSNYSAHTAQMFFCVSSAQFLSSGCWCKIDSFRLSSPTVVFRGAALDGETFFVGTPESRIKWSSIEVQCQCRHSDRS